MSMDGPIGLASPIDGQLPGRSQIHRLDRRHFPIEYPPFDEDPRISAANLVYELQELIGGDVPMLIAIRPGFHERE